MTGDTVTVRGIAYTGGDAEVACVELSVDGGATWQRAEVEERPADGRWAWRRFEGVLQAPAPRAETSGEASTTDGQPETGLEILARAMDTSGRRQPEHTGGIWNFKGYMNNAWCRVRVER